MSKMRWHSGQVQKSGAPGCWKRRSLLWNGDQERFLLFKLAQGDFHSVF